MPQIKFDYFVNPLIVNKRLEAMYYPIISLRVSSQYKIYPNSLNCILDSGSDFNVMSADIAQSLGINTKKGEKVTHTGIGNINIIAYKHPVTFYLEGYKFKTEVHFSYDHKISLLGRHGFLKFFKKVTFNEKALQVELEY